MKSPLFLTALLLAGCAADGAGRWPTLARRAGERDSGPVCPRCGPDDPAAAVVAPPAQLPLPPAGADAELAGIDRELLTVERAVPPQIDALARAQVRARGKDEADDAAVEAEVQRTRLDALLAPLDDWQERLTALADSIAGTQGGEAVTLRVTALQDRIAALRTVAAGTR